MGCHFLLQGIFLTQGSNPHLTGRLRSALADRFFTTEPPGGDSWSSRILPQQLSFPSHIPVLPLGFLSAPLSSTQRQPPPTPQPPGWSRTSLPPLKGERQRDIPMINIHIPKAENNTDELLTRAGVFWVPGIDTLYVPIAGVTCFHVRNDLLLERKDPAQGTAELNPRGPGRPACCPPHSPAPSFRATLSQPRATGTTETETELSKAMSQVPREVNSHTDVQEAHMHPVSPGGTRDQNSYFSTVKCSVQVWAHKKEQLLELFLFMINLRKEWTWSMFPYL